MLEELSKSIQVICMQYRGITFPRVLSGVEIKPVSYFTWGIAPIVNKLLGKQLTVPIGVKSFSNIVRDINPDYVVTADFFHWSFFQAIAYKKKYPQTKLILLSESKAFPQNKLSKLIFSWFFRYLKSNIQHVDYILTPTAQAENFYKAHFPNSKIVVIPPSVDTTIFSPIDTKSWLPDNKLRILMNARYVPYKRHEDLLQASVCLQKTGQKFHITFVGYAGEGKERVEKRVVELGLLDAVTFAEPVSLKVMATMYHQHDVLVLPSYNEAIGLVVPEAMACGLPTITTNTVGANVYVEEEVTGFVYKTGDTYDLCKLLIKCTDASLTEKMGISASNKMNSFTKESITKEFLSQLN